MTLLAVKQLRVALPLLFSAASANQPVTAYSLANTRPLAAGSRPSKARRRENMSWGLVYTCDGGGGGMQFVGLRYELAEQALVQEQGLWHLVQQVHATSSQTPTPIRIRKDPPPPPLSHGTQTPRWARPPAARRSWR